MKCKAGKWMACYSKPVPETPLQNEIIFQLPRRLENNDKIEISGKMSPNPERIFLNLKSTTRFPGYQKINCKLEVNFSSQKIIFKIKENGKENEYEVAMCPSELFPDSEFKFTINVCVEGSATLYVYIGEAYVNCWDVMENLKNIQFLTFSHDINKVEELKFRYA